MAFHAPASRFLHHSVGPGLVGRVVQQTTDVVNKERIQKICDFLLVGKLQCALKRNPLGWLAGAVLLMLREVDLFASLLYSPNTLQMHRANFHHMAQLLALEYTITSSTGHTCDIQQFCTVDHVVVWIIELN